MASVKGKKIVVTGAAGFIGSHLTEKLLRENARVTALIRYTSDNRRGWLEHIPVNLINKLNTVFGDIRDPDICAEIVKGNDYIFHLAAQIAIPYSYIAPRDFLNVNTMGTANLLQTAKQIGIKKFLHISTSEVYGELEYAPIDENHPQTAHSPYAASKIGADRIAESFYHTFDLPVTIIRPFNCYGPRQSSRAVIPTIILQALKRKSVKLGNIYPHRDMNYVDDIVNGMIKACFSQQTTGMTLNLATGVDYSIKQMVEIVGDLMGKKLAIKSDQKRKRPKDSEVDRLIGDNTLAKQYLEYNPGNDLKTGLKKTIKFYEDNFDKYDREDYRL